MHSPSRGLNLTVAALLVAVLTTLGSAQQPTSPQTPRISPAGADLQRSEPLSLAQAQGERASTDQHAVAVEERRRGEETVSKNEEEGRLSIDAYTSLEDGQPDEPGQFQVALRTGWQTKSGEHDPVFLEPEIEYTFDGSEFLRNTTLTLAVPMELGLGGVNGTGDLDFGWQQRWVREDGMTPTIATLAEMRIPSGYHSSGVDGTLTGIVTKTLGPGMLVFNGFVKTANGDNIEELRHFQWGLRGGYKWQITDALALIGDYVHQCSEEEGHANSNLLEIATEYRVNEHLTVGPGIVIGLDRNEETPNLGAGLSMKYSF